VAGYLGLNTFGSQKFSESSTSSNGDVNFGNATSFGGALGLRITPQLRVEGEVSYRRSDPGTLHVNGGADLNANGALKTWMFMANAYYDFDVSWKNFQPYVGAGVGLASHHLNLAYPGLASGSGDTLALAYQLGGGLKYRLSPESALTGSYRYVGSSDIDADTYTMEYSSHEWRLGIEYDLPVSTFRNMVK